MPKVLIAADPEVMSAADLKIAVESHLATQGSLVEFVPDEDQGRALAAAVLVAAVSAVSTVVTGIIGAMMAAAKGKAERKIVVQGSKGGRVEIPADTPLDTIEFLVRQAQLLDDESVRIGLT